MAETHSRRVVDGLDAARRDLLDLSLRNPLLNYRLPRSRGVRLADEPVPGVWRRLADDDGSLALKPAPAPGSANANPAQVATIHPEDELDRRLLGIRRMARLASEEQGAHVLHLAVGALVWREANDATERIAPLLLLPVDLTIDGQGRGRIACSGDGEPVANVCLHEWLRREYRLEIPMPVIPPPLSDDAEPTRFAPLDWLASVATALAGHPHVRIDPAWMVLDGFAFSTFAMYRDLDPETWPAATFAAHPVLDPLFGDGFAAVAPDDPVALAVARAPGQCLEVIDADGSQQAVLAAARRGMSLVVQGPPGTGKSQTIINLIAEAVHDGKRVLFVAEKQAALHVVLRRLQQLGLGDACIDIASDSVVRRTIAAEIKRTLTAPSPPPLGTDPLPELLSVRQELDRAWAAERAAVAGGPSIAERTDLAVDAPSVADAPDLGGEALAGIAEIEWPNVRSQAEALALALRRADVDARRFAISPRTTIGPDDEQRLREAAASAVTAVCECVAAHAALSSVWNDVPAHTLAAARARAALAHHVAHAPAGANWRHPAWNDLAALSRGLDAIVAADRAQGELIPRVTTAAWSCDSASLAALRSDLVGFGGSVFSFLSSKWRAAKRQVASLVAGPAPTDLPQCVAAVDALIEVHRLRAVAEPLRAAVIAAAGSWRQGDSPDATAMRAAIAWRAACPACPADFFSSPRELTKAVAERVVTATGRAEAAIASVAGILGCAVPDAVAFTQLSEDLAAWARHAARWADWAAVVAARDRMLAAGRGSMHHDAESATAKAAHAALDWASAAHELPAAIERARIDGVFARACREHPALAQLDPATLAQLRQRHARLDREWQERNRRLVAQRHRDALQERSAMPGMNLIRREAEKKARHLSLRMLVSRAGAAFQAVKPVMLMSPAAVAAHLAPEAVHFDLVVMDEASQVRPADSLGALCRARQAVIVGDSRQMPPTAFFRRLDSGSEDDPASDDVNATGDLESVLGLFLAQGAPSRMLRWHYRSRHPSLIAISNHHCYDGRLVTFPSPSGAVAKVDGDGLSIVRVPDGVYDRAATRTNRAEAQAIVRAIAAHAAQRPELTLGVAALSVAQTDCIESELARVAARDPVISAFLAAHPHEPCFVKNLENVQGDERDAILISTGYGRDADGKLTRQFGPVGAVGGERRLNVLITRARRSCRVFTSLDPEDLSGEVPPGVAMLRDAIAGSGRSLSGSWNAAGTTGLARVIRTAIAGADMRQVPGLGFAVMGSEGAQLGLFDPGQLGSGAMLRDRERLAEEHLIRLGWRLQRIHPAAWWRRPAREAEAMLAALAPSAIPSASFPQQ